MSLGRTIAELQATMSLEEMQVWLAYRRKYGPMNPVRAFEAGPALIASTIINAVPGRRQPPVKPIEFMPYGKQPEPDVVVDSDEFFEAFSNMPGVKHGRVGR